MDTAERDPARGVEQQPAELERAPFVAWADFLPRFMAAWRSNTAGQAEHVTIEGPTGQGKSVLGLTLIDQRAEARGSHVVVFATKPTDRELLALGRQPGWHIIRRWPPSYGQDRVIFWPPFGKVGDHRRRHAQVFREALEAIFHERGRVLYIDEAAYLADDLGLADLMTSCWQMGRSQNLIMVAGTQRPVKVPRAMWSEATWLFAFRTTDEDELRRVSEIGGTDKRQLADVIRNLRPHEFVACRTRTGDMVRSRVER